MRYGYGKNLTPLEDSWAYAGDAVKKKFHKPNGWKARRSAGY